MSKLLTRARANGFSDPPPRKVPCPIIDIHVHGSGVEATRGLFEAARRYDISRLGVIVQLEAGIALQQAFPETSIITWLDWEHVDDPEQFAQVNREIVQRAAREGGRLIKLWFAPRFRERKGLGLETGLLDPVLAEIQRQGLGVLIHIADPDIWFERVYTDVDFFGTKADQYGPFEERMTAYRGIPFLAAHMAGDPENLEHVGSLLERHPNLYVDTGSTRWMARELGKQPETCRDFFRQYKDRVLFGSDQTPKQDDPHAYTARYWSHQVLWETDTVCELPIDDNDSDGPPMLRGVNLPAEVLPWFYHKNAERIFGVTPAQK